jgi:hypothetical protein
MRTRNASVSLAGAVASETLAFLVPALHFHHYQAGNPDISATGLIAGEVVTNFLLRCQGWNRGPWQSEQVSTKGGCSFQKSVEILPTEVGGSFNSSLHTRQPEFLSIPPTSVGGIFEMHTPADF